MTPDYYVEQFRQVATFLKAPEGARPLIVASGGNDEDTSWTQALVSKARHDKRFDMGAISFHYYTVPSGHFQSKGPATGFGEDQWISTEAQALRIDGFIARNSAILDQYDPEKKVSFAVDEWGTWYDPEPGREPGFLYQQNTLRDAMTAALTLNIFHHHADRVRLANIAQLVNVLQAMILTKGPQMLLTPTYHVFHMFRPFQDATLLATDLKAPNYEHAGVSVPAISMSAAHGSDGALLLALANLDPKSASALSVSITGAQPKHVSGEVLTASTMDARNTFETPDAVHPTPFSGATLKGGTLAVTLPAKSVVVLRLE